MYRAFSFDWLSDHSNKKAIVVFLTLFCISSLFNFPVIAGDEADTEYVLKPKSQAFPVKRVGTTTDISSDVLSVEAVAMAKQLNILSKLQRLGQLYQEQRSEPSGKLSLEAKDEFRDLKVELSEVIEETRLEIDYAKSELDAEEALQTEVVRSYARRRDIKTNLSNVWSFRTNGVLWTICEALSIPTYSHPRYSISSGTFGILAGLVPSAFSMVAVHQSSGGKFDRKPWPNMLSKIFDYPVIPRVDYPPSVWTFLNSPSARRPNGKSRINILIDQWVEDKNIGILTDRTSRQQLDLVTGNGQQHLTIDLLTDRISMLTQLDALIGLMNRPLLELMMAVRGTKHLPPER